LAIGSFDGLHIAHNELFKRLGKNGAIFVIETPHTNLTPNGYRGELYKKHKFFYMPLDKIKNLLANEFIEQLCNMFPKVNKIVVGYDFKFGKNKTGKAVDIKKYFNGCVEIVDEIKKDNISIHSRIIRGYIRVGDIKSANNLLGRTYSIKAKIIKGQGIGKTKLVPTINLSNEYMFLLPNSGVYATSTKIDNLEYNSISFIGHRVTTDGEFSIETHIINQNIEITSGYVEIFFIEKVRDNMMFNSLKELKKQILQDIKKVSKIVIGD